MKKFFTLCAALAMVMGASAAPQLAKAVKADKPMLEHRLIGHTPAKVAYNASAQKAKAFGLSLATKKAQAAATELTYDELTIEDYGTDVWFKAVSSDGAYRILVNPDVPMDQLELGTVYTMEDMLETYTYMVDNANSSTIGISDIDFVLSENEVYGMVFDAQIETADGQEFHVSYKELELPTEFTEVPMGDITLRLKDFRETDGAIQFTFLNDRFDGAIALETQEIAGSYTTADVFGGLNNYTFVYDNQLEAKLCNIEAEVTALGANDYALTAKLYSYNGNVYVMDAKYVEPKAENRAEITCSNLVLDASSWDLYMMFFGYGVAQFTASNDNYDILGTITSYDGEIEGNYDDADHLLSMTINDVEVFSSNVVIAADGSSYTVKGDVLAWDNTVYTLDLYFTVPEPDEERDFTSTVGELADLTADLGAIQIMVDDYDWFSVVLDMNQITPGHYTEMSSQFADYCQIVLDQAGAQEILPMYSIDFDLAVNGEEFTLTGTCQAGSILYNVNISGVVSGSEPEDDPRKEYDMQEDVTATFAAEDIADFEVLPEDGYAFIRVNNGTEMFSTLIYIDGDELEAGVYEINTTYAPGTAQAGDLDMTAGSVYPAFYGTLTEDGYINVPLFLCVAGTVTVDFDAAGLPVVVADATNLWGCNAHIEVNPQGTVAIENVAAQAAKNGKFFENNAVVIRNNGQQYNAFGQIVK